MKKLEPNGVSLQPQPFMPGVFSLQEQAMGKLSPTSQHRLNLQKTLNNQTFSKSGFASNLSSGLAQSNKDGGSSSKGAYRSNSKQQYAKKKMLHEAYNLI